MTTIDPNANPNLSAVTSALETLVGPDKKFGTAEDLAKGKLESDTYIKTLERETASLRALVTQQDQRVQKLEAKSSILDRLEPNPNPDNQTVVTTQKLEPQVTPGLTAEDVLELVEQRDVNRTATQNKSEVDAVLAKQFGADAVAVVQAKARELGMTAKELANIGFRSPKAFYSMLGIDPNATQSGTLYNGSGRSGPTNKVEVRNKAHYDAIQAKVGVKAFILDRNLQSQLHKDMTQLGEAFFA